MTVIMLESPRNMTYPFFSFSGQLLPMGTFISFIIEKICLPFSEGWRKHLPLSELKYWYEFAIHVQSTEKCQIALRNWKAAQFSHISCILSLAILIFNIIVGELESIWKLMRKTTQPKILLSLGKHRLGRSLPRSIPSRAKASGKQEEGRRHQREPENQTIRVVYRAVVERRKDQWSVWPTYRTSSQAVRVVITTRKK